MCCSLSLQAITFKTGISVKGHSPQLLRYPLVNLQDQRSFISYHWNLLSALSQSVRGRHTV